MAVFCALVFGNLCLLVLSVLEEFGGLVSFVLSDAGVWQMCHRLCQGCCEYLSKVVSCLQVVARLIQIDYKPLTPKPLIPKMNTSLSLALSLFSCHGQLHPPAAKKSATELPRSRNPGSQALGTRHLLSC